MLRPTLVAVLAINLMLVAFSVSTDARACSVSPQFKHSVIVDVDTPVCIEWSAVSDIDSPYDTAVTAKNQCDEPIEIQPDCSTVAMPGPDCDAVTLAVGAAEVFVVAGGTAITWSKGGESGTVMTQREQESLPPNTCDMGCSAATPLPVGALGGPLVLVLAGLGFWGWRRRHLAVS